MLKENSKDAIVNFLVRELKLEEEQAKIFVENRDLEIRRLKILEKLDNEMVTKDFVMAEFDKFDKRMTIYFVITLVVIVISNLTLWT